MKLTVLTDNNTFIDQYYCGEPGVCFYIEDEGSKLLLDTGYSNVFMKNAKAMGINLAEVSTIVLSHGHNDHTGGLQYLLQEFPLQNTNIAAHPYTFKGKTYGDNSIGSPVSEEYLAGHSKLLLSRTPVKVSKNITFLGEIPRSNQFEQRRSFGVIHGCGCEEIGSCGCSAIQDDVHAKESVMEDFVADDSALVYNSGNGLFIITGCSHSGICNITEYAKQVCGEEKIIGIIGGFHLFKVSEQLSQTIRYFQTNHITELYPCHCVSFAVKAEIHRHIPIHEVGVGMQIEF